MVLQNQFNELISIVRKHSQTQDSGKELARQITTSLKDRGYFSLLLPDYLGGEQLNYPDYIDLVFSFARVDASTAWCINQGSVLSSLARLVDKEIAKTIWQNCATSLANGPPATSCESIHTNLGFKLTGSWNFSSGIAHADWLIGSAKATMKNGSKTMMMHLLPKSSAKIDKTWDVIGLKQTGSYQFSTKFIMIPETHAFTYKVRECDPPIYQIPLNLLFAGGFAAVALGTSRAAIDHAIEKSHAKVKRFTQTALREESTTQEIIGQTEAIWQAAHSYLLSTVETTWSKTVEKGACPKEEKYKLRLAATHAIRQAKIATDMVYDLLGTDSIHQSEPIHRYFQDVHVISQHLQARPEVYAIVGGHKLGLPTESYLVD